MKENFIHCLEQISFYKDEDMGQHSRRVGELAYLLARKLNVANQVCKDIKIFSSLHDIGKVGIPDIILLKETKLDNDEFDCIKKHTEIGFDLIKKVGFGTTAENIVKYHHEKWDGSGYPSGLKGESIPLEARITSIADVYDALRQKRCYKLGFSHELAIEILKEGSSINFDPEILKVFLDNSDEFEDVFKDM
ncbi:MAG: HD-GYP domain-containing protein [Cetobacterium sp.]